MKSLRPRLNYRMRLLILAGIVMPQAATHTQILPGETALDIRVDARSVAMGESFVGVAGDASAPIENPAGLGTLTGIRAFYAHRANNWLTQNPDADYTTAALAFSVPFGTIGVLYSRADAGELPVFGTTSPEPIGTVGSHTNMLALAFGRTITGGLSCGVSVKGFDEKYTGTSGDPGLFYESQGCFLLDLGILFTTPGTLEGDRIVDEVSAGVALQNFGTDLKEQISYDHTTPHPSQLVRVPRYFRIGLSYHITFEPTVPEALTPAHLMLSGEYREMVNPDMGQESERDYWGLGVEATLYEILSLRMGAFTGGTWSIYGDKGVPALRYGAGLTIPFVRLGAAIPLTARFDYAGIPLQDLPAFPSLQARKTLPVFTVGIRYEASAF